MRTQCFEIPSGKAGEEAEEKAEGGGRGREGGGEGRGLMKRLRKHQLPS